MRASIIALFLTFCIGGAALAQQQSRNARPNSGKTYRECASLAVSRGYRLTDTEYDVRPAARFIEDCVSGRQR